MAGRKKKRVVKRRGSENVKNFVVHEIQEDGRRTANRKRSPIGVLTVVLFAIIMMYMVKYTIDFAAGSSNITIDSVDYGTIDIPNSFEGLVVRDEYVVNATKSGQPSFNYAEGDKVKKNASVCTVSESESASTAQERLRVLDESIIETQKNKIDISKYKDEITGIENSIASSIASAQSRIAMGNYNDVYTMRSAVQTQMDLRTDIWIEENSESSDTMASQRRSYQTQLANSLETLTAPESGILVLSSDGCEDKFTPDTLETITKNDIQSSYDIEYTSKTMAVEAGSTVFKIVRDNNWYVCSYIDSSVASDWQVGDTKTIRAVVDKSEVSVEASIHSMTPGDNETYVVFRTNKNIQDFLNVRTLEFYISDSTYQGLKIPNTAIVEKTFLKIPIGCVAESLSGSTVVRRSNGRDELVSVTVESSDEQYAYIRQDFDVLKIGDVILNGTGENAAEYTINEVSTQVGVLTANGAYAQFASISVLGQNSQYTIADSASSSLKAYDKIIVNAADASEGDEIY